MSEIDANILVEGQKAVATIPQEGEIIKDGGAIDATCLVLGSDGKQHKAVKIVNIENEPVSQSAIDAQVLTDNNELVTVTDEKDGEIIYKNNSDVDFHCFVKDDNNEKQLAVKTVEIDGEIIKTGGAIDATCLVQGGDGKQYKAIKVFNMGGPKDWKGKPESWPDIRENLIPNSIRLLADERYPLGFTATATGGYTVKIDGQVKGTYSSGAQCSIPATDWPKGNIDSLTAYGGTEQRNLPEGHTQLEYVDFNSGSNLQITNVPITSAYKIEFDFETRSVTSALRNILGGRASGVSAGGGIRLTRLSNGGVAMYGFDTTDAYESGANVISADTRYKFVYDNGTCTLYSGDTVVLTHTYTINDNTSVTAWGINTYSANNGTSWTTDSDEILVYSLKVWNGNGELVFNLIPDKQSSTIGLYDGTNTLRTASRGTWTAGPEAVPSPDNPIDIVSNNGALKARHQSGLPLGYTLLDYIQSSGTQYIDTGIVTSLNMSAEIKGQFLTVDTNSAHFLSARNGTDGYNTLLAWNNNSGGGYFTQFLNDAYYSRYVTPKDTNVNVITGAITATSCTTGYNGQVATSTATNVAQNMSLYLNARHIVNGAIDIGTYRYYYAKIWKDGILVRDFIPAKDSSNVVGMYDTVSGQFFTNQGTGTFTAGSAVSDPVEIYTDGTVETVQVTGKNLFDSTPYKTGYYIDASGNEQPATQYQDEYIIRQAIVQPSTQYTLSFVCTLGGYTQRFHAYDKDGNWISQITAQSPSVGYITEYTFTTPINCKYIRQGGRTQTDYQLELGSTATDYEPYYYGGSALAEMLLKVGDYQDTQEVIAGTVTRNVGIKVLDGTEDIGKSSVYAGSFFIRNVVSGWGTSNNAQVYCSHFGVVTESSNYVQNKCIILNNAFNMWWASDNTSTVAQFTQWLADQYAAGTPVIVVYPLATATTESVTPQTLSGTSASVTAGSINDLQITYTQSSAGYPIDYPTGAETAHIIDIYPSTEGNNITAFKCARVAASGVETQGLLWVHFNIDNQINLTYCANSASAYSQPLLTSVTAKKNKLSTNSLYYAFRLSSLEYTPDFIFASNMSYLLDGAFQGTKIKKITIQDTAFTQINEAFANCQYLEKINFKNVNFSNLTATQEAITNAVMLKDTHIDFSPATGLKKVGLHGTSSYFMGGLKGLRVSSSAPFDGTAPQINVSYTGMDRSALVQLFNDLPTVTGGQIINVTGCSGASNLTGADMDIAINKGWTITGSRDYVIEDGILTWANPNVYLQNLTGGGSDSGFGYIDAGFKPTNKTTYEVCLQRVSMSGATNASPFNINGPTVDGVSYNSFGINQMNQDAFNYNNNQEVPAYPSWNDFFTKKIVKTEIEGTDYKATVIYNNGAYVRSKTFTLADDTFQTFGNLYIGCWNYGYNSGYSAPYYPIIGNLYYAKFYEDGTLIRHFVPVPQGLEIGNFTVPANGWFDIVHQQFYTNLGDTAFTYGKDS